MVQKLIPIHLAHWTSPLFIIFFFLLFISVINILRLKKESEHWFPSMEFSESQEFTKSGTFSVFIKKALIYNHREIPWYTKIVHCQKYQTIGKKMLMW